MKGVQGKQEEPKEAPKGRREVPEVPTLAPNAAMMVPMRPMVNSEGPKEDPEGSMEGQWACQSLTEKSMLIFQSGSLPQGCFSEGRMETFKVNPRRI